MRPLLLIGAGGHAESCIDVIEQEGRFEIVGLIGRPAEVGNTVLGYKVLGDDDQIGRLLREVSSVLVTVGHIKTPQPRIELFAKLLALGAEFPTVISPRAYVSRHAVLGDGTIVMHGAVVNANARIGHNCIVNSLALVEHGVSIGDHCHVATSAAVNSGVQVGPGTFIGSGSSIRQCLSIGAGCLIGMGQAVVADCPDGTHLPRRKDPA